MLKVARYLLVSMIRELETNNRPLLDDYLLPAPLAEKIGISPNGIKQHISKLKSEGLIKRIGGRKDGYWKMMK